MDNEDVPSLNLTCLENLKRMREELENIMISNDAVPQELFDREIGQIEREIEKLKLRRVVGRIVDNLELPQIEDLSCENMDKVEDEMMQSCKNLMKREVQLTKMKKQSDTEQARKAKEAKQPVKIGDRYRSYMSSCIASSSLNPDQIEYYAFCDCAAYPFDWEHHIFFGYAIVPMINGFLRNKIVRFGFGIEARDKPSLSSFVSYGEMKCMVEAMEAGLDLDPPRILIVVGDNSAVVDCLKERKEKYGHKIHWGLLKTSLQLQNAHYT